LNRKYFQLSGNKIEEIIISSDKKVVCPAWDTNILTHVGGTHGMEAIKEKIVDMTELLKFAVKSDASDLHISAGESPMFRIHGEIRRIDMEPLTDEEVHTMIYDILNDQQRKMFEENRELDFSIALGEYGRFRVNVFVQHRGDAAVLRTIPNQVKSFEDLGLPKICKAITRAEKGLVLVTGPTGCGKSTSLATMIDSINSTVNKHIITIEDPIEFLHESKNAWLINGKWANILITSQMP